MKIPSKTLTENGLMDVIDFGISGITFKQIADYNTAEEIWDNLSEEQQTLVLDKMLDGYYKSEEYCSEMIRRI